MQQIYRRTPMPKCDFNKVTKIILKNPFYWFTPTALRRKVIDFLHSILILCDEVYHQKVLWLPCWFIRTKIAIAAWELAGIQKVDPRSTPGFWTNFYWRQEVTDVPFYPYRKNYMGSILEVHFMYTLFILGTFKVQ